MTDQIKSDINALVDSSLQPRRLPVVEPVGGYPAQRGRSTYAAAQAAAGGGIASPLTETDAATRQYWDESMYLSGDYLVGIIIRPLKQIVMTDSAGEPVVMRYAEPDYD